MVCARATLDNRSKKMISRKTLIFVAVAAALASGVSLADTKNQGYLVDTNGNIVTSSTTGLCWRTGDWTPARAVAQCDPVMKVEVPVARVAAVTPAPAPAPQAAPKPAPQPAPAKTTTRKINFSADALFAFDRAVLKPEGKVMLDDLVRDLKGAQYDIIVATGHTDRFGSEQYNQKLSERRAQAVKEYLVSKEIPANLITAAGKGETQPVTKAGDCPGAKSAKVIACLQPDRRVDVEVTGSKTSTTESR
jgi:OOP family OmpA-OmpF porin